MTDFPMTPAAAHLPILRSLIARLARAIRLNFEVRAALRVNRRRAAALSRLDDHLLEDIGLTRTDVNEALTPPGDLSDTLAHRTTANRAADLERPRLRAR